MIGKTNAVSGGKIKIPSVSNLNVDEWGDLTFDEPDYSKLAKYDPTISYIINVNGSELEATTNSVSILNLLVEGENTVSVTVKAVIRYFSSDTSEVVMFSLPQYTDVSLFTLESTTVDGVNGYKITAYNGTDTEISIPPQNTDGLPILELNSLAVSKITGSDIKKLNSFGNNGTITEVNFPKIINTSLRNFFRECRKLKKVTALNTSNVTDMVYMFYYCSSLTTIPQLDTSNVIYMTSMFRNCSALTTIPALNTSNVTNMDSMFSDCLKLTEIPALDTSKVTNMNSMFSYCSALTTIPALNTSNVTNMGNMFSYCSKLTNIPLLDTTNVTKMGSMFNGCLALTTIPQLDTSNTTDMGGMFNGCRGLMIVPLLNTSKVTVMNYMFQNCERLTEIPAFDVSNVNAFSSTFHNCISLRSIHMTGMKASFDISESTQFTDNDLHEIIDNLATVSSTQTLTMGATNLAKVSQEYVAKATSKGWTLA